MIRSLIGSLLLLSCHGVMAEQLYRWVEADGSITFSPNPPAGNVPYDAVPASAALRASMASSGGDLTLPARSPQAPAAAPATRISPVAPLEPAPTAASASTGQPKLGAALPATARGVDVQNGTRKAARLVYAPEQDRPIAAQPSSKALPGSDAVEQQPDVATDNKRQKCNDLRKRVISLERRLKTGLTPDDMDNTVVHMARYQQSYDKFCDN